jgi:hypothetical protein
MRMGDDLQFANSEPANLRPKLVRIAHAHTTTPQTAKKACSDAKTQSAHLA